MIDKTFIDKFIRNDKGKVTIFQKPNLPILVWGAATLFAKLSQGTTQDFFGLIAFGALFTWSWLEIFMGANYVRKLLGLVIFTATIYGRLKH